MAIDCRQLDEALDSYVHGELSPEAMAAAAEHAGACARCRRAIADRRALRDALRRTVAEAPVPDDLPRRVSATLRAERRRWLGLPRAAGPAAATVALAASLALAAAAMFSPLAFGAAALFDRAAVVLDESHHATLDGMLLCRDCELERRYGVRAQCPVIGHHGAVVTSDGRIWSIIEQPGSAHLIHDSTLLGRKIRARGTVFRAASSVAIDSFEFLDPPAAASADHAAALRLVRR